MNIIHPCNKALQDCYYNSMLLPHCNNKLPEEKSYNSKVYRIGQKYSKIIDRLAEQRGISKRQALESLIDANYKSENNDAVKSLQDQVKALAETTEKIVNFLISLSRKISTMER